MALWEEEKVRAAKAGVKPGLMVRVSSLLLLTVCSRFAHGFAHCLGAAAGVEPQLAHRGACGGPAAVRLLHAVPPPAAHATDPPRRGERPGEPARHRA